MAGFGNNGGGGGGWNSVTASNVKNQSLPALLRCSVCKKEKNRSDFSNKQIQNAQQQLWQATRHLPQGKRAAAKPQVEIRCRLCVGSVRHELQCVACGETKDLNEFAKVQRQKSDEARCQACQNEILAVEPEDHVATIGRYSDDDDDYDDDDDIDWDDGQSTITGITNPWQMGQNGDYATRADITSTATSSVSGARSTTASGSVSGRSGNFPGRTSLAAASSSKAVPQIARNIMDMSIQDHDNEDEYPPVSRQSGNQTAWGNFGRSAATRNQKAPAPARATTFNAWGPQGQHAVHNRVTSSASATSSAGYQQSNQSRPKPTKPPSKFAKVKPDNSKEPDGKGKGRGTDAWADDDDDNSSAW